MALAVICWVPPPLSYQPHGERRVWAAFGVAAHAQSTLTDTNGRLLQAQLHVLVREIMISGVTCSEFGSSPHGRCVPARRRYRAEEQARRDQRHHHLSVCRP